MIEPTQIANIEQKVLDLSKPFLDNDEVMLADQLAAEILDTVKPVNEGLVPDEQTLEKARNYIRMQLIRYGRPKESYTAAEICILASMMVKEAHVYHLMTMLR